MIPDYPIGQDIPIDEQGTWPASVHVFKEPTVAALQAAEATGRPLLVRGLPGVGKSETARAAAAFAHRPFLATVIDGRTEPDDLKWSVDAVARLSDAHAHVARDELEYVRPQALWWAYDWAGAKAQALTCRLPTPDAKPHRTWKPASNRTVLLLDEIDKADPDLPNALLEVLANKGFTPPFKGAKPVRCTDATRPLIVITTNEERELPAAFLRRCLVLTLSLPGSEAELRRELIDLALRHEARHQAGLAAAPDARITEAMLQEVADCFLDLRHKAEHAGDYLPGTSEFLDLVRALATLYPGDATRQRERLALLSTFVSKSLQAQP